MIAISRMRAPARSSVTRELDRALAVLHVREARREQRRRPALEELARADRELVARETAVAADLDA